MTDELSPEFLLFSEMLDDEDKLGESSVAAFGEDGAILMELRRALRGEGHQVDLPENFAASTSTHVLEKFQEFSWWAKSLLKAEAVFQGEAFSRATLVWSSALVGVGLGSALISWNLFGIYGVALMLAGIGWNVVSRIAIPGFKQFRGDVRFGGDSAWFSRVFFVLPILASLATSMLVGRALSKLGTFSFTFRESENGLALLAIVGSGGVFLLLINGLTPTWKALCEKGKSSVKWTFGIQILHGVWLALALAAWVMFELALSGQSSAANDIRIVEELARNRFWTLALLWGAFTGVVFAGILFRIPTSNYESNGLWAGFKKTIKSLLFAGIPILLCLAGFYQMSLTREIVDPQVYDRLIRDTEQWLKEQKAIPPNQNGWTELKDYFLKEEVPNKEHKAVSERLYKGSEMYAYWGPEKSTSMDVKAKAEEAKKEFLSELPRIQSALSKPYFTSMSTQDLTASSLVPNFIRARAVSQGLTSLALESIQEGKTAEALGYIEDGLKWSKTMDDGVLINLMIGAAQTSIAYEPVEKFVFKAHPSREQLTRLLDSLTLTSFEQIALLEAMKRDIFTIDGAMKSLSGSEGGWEESSEFFSGGQAAALERLVPRSYWQSERKAYLNLLLAQFQDWRELGQPTNLDLEEEFPMSFAAQAFTPNWKRAQIQFCKVLSQQAALRLVVALEIYQRDHGSYPKTLDALVPTYLPELPKDAISPNLWKMKPTFGYRLTPKGYELISQSPLYDAIQLRTRQVYGPDRPFGFQKR